jgi:hypothetical protein
MTSIVSPAMRSRSKLIAGSLARKASLVIASENGKSLKDAAFALGITDGGARSVIRKNFGVFSWPIKGHEPDQ